MKIIQILLFVFILAGVSALTAQTPPECPSLSSSYFGTTTDGQQANLYTLTNCRGTVVKLTNYGGIVTQILVKDYRGNAGDIVLGFDSLKGYLGEHPYFGAIIGRYANRIAKGKFTLGGHEYTLAKNNGNNSLHGGIRGFDKRIWKAEPIKGNDSVGVRLIYRSADGEEGYPGNLTASVTYSLNNSNELRIEYEAVTDKPTVVNLTNHSYFNLSATDSTDILQHALMINASRYTVVDSELIPTGEQRPVENTPMDFRTLHRIGERIDQVPGGYDHNYVLNRNEEGLVLAARVFDEKSGRILTVRTTEPGVQFYSGNFLDGTNIGKGGRVYNKHYGFCLEAQHFPDSPNHPKFPSVVLKPGETYRQTTVYWFSANPVEKGEK